MSFLNKYLSVWILSAMVIGVSLGNYSSLLSHYIADFSIGSTSIPIAIGLIAMMIPPLAKVQYEGLGRILKDYKVMNISLLLNWIIGPVLMFLLGLLFLSSAPALFMGLILIGLARCIAMVIVWSELAHGNRDYTAALIGLNSIFQLVAYAPMTFLFIVIIPQWMGMDLGNYYVPFSEVSKSVGIYLGIPFIIGFGLRKILRPLKGAHWYDTVFLTYLSPMTLIFLLATIILMFTLQGKAIVDNPFVVLQVSIPLIIYFVAMFFAALGWSLYRKVPFNTAVSVAFTAGSNNFELAIAVAIALFGINSQQAFVGVIGPLIEVPIMLLLVHVTQWVRGRLQEKGTDI